MKLIHNLAQCLSEITNQGAADAARIHFCNVDPGVLQEAAVDSDLAKFILDQNDLLTGEHL